MKNDFLMQDSEFLETLKDESENADRSGDRGIVNEEQGSSILLRENGDAAIAGSSLAQIKIDAEGNSITEIAYQSNTVANRKNLIIDEITINDHKLNSHLVDMADRKVLFGKKETAAGNWNMAGTMLVKVWDRRKNKWILIRRQARMPFLYNEMTLPATPYNMSIDDGVDFASLESEEIDKMFSTEEKDPVIEKLRQEYAEKGFDKMPLAALEEYIENKKNAKAEFDRTGKWNQDLAKRNAELREKYGIKDDMKDVGGMEQMLKRLKGEESEAVRKYYKADASEVKKILENKQKAQEEFKQTGKWNEKLAKENEEIRKKLGLEDIDTKQLEKIVDESSYSSIALNERYYSLPIETIDSLIANKTKAEQEFKKTGKWNQEISIKNQVLRERAGITKDLSISELKNIKDEIERRSK